MLRNALRQLCFLSFLLGPRLLAQQVPPVGVRGAVEQGAEELAEVLVAVRAARIAYCRDSTQLDACSFAATFHGDSIKLSSELQSYLAATTGGEVLVSCAAAGSALAARDLLVSQVTLTTTTADVTLSRRVKSEIVLENFTVFRCGKMWYLRKIVIAPIGKV